MYSYVIRMSHVCTRMSFVCTRMLSVCYSYVLVCQSYVLVCHPYVTRMYTYVARMYLHVIRMSLICTRMSFICHSYVLLCTRMSQVCHSYVLVCHPYVTHMYSYVIRMSLVCGFTMNPCRQQNRLLVFIEELVKLFCNSYWQNTPVTATVHYFHYNSHHHCKMHLDCLKILLTIPLCNMIPCLLHRHIFFFSLIPSFLLFTPSKRAQNLFTTIRHILDVLFILTQKQLFTQKQSFADILRNRNS